MGRPKYKTTEEIVEAFSMDHLTRPSIANMVQYYKKRGDMEASDMYREAHVRTKPVKPAPNPLRLKNVDQELLEVLAGRTIPTDLHRVIEMIDETGSELKCKRALTKLAENDSRFIPVKEGVFQLIKDLEWLAEFAKEEDDGKGGFYGLK